MVKLAQSLLALTLLLAAATAAAATVEVDVSPEPVILGEACRISFKVSGAIDGEPDFAPLETHFDILARNRQSALNWTNGRREQSTTWVLSAMPRAAGKAEIPPLDFGGIRSPARTVEIVARAAGARSDAPADILLRVDIDNRTPYVQQQVIYTIRLLHRVDLSSPRFSALETSADAIIKPLGDGRQYLEKVDGLTYEAFEQRYAIFPQQSGPLTIKPVVLTTQVVSGRGRRSFFDPFSQALQTRRVASEALDLEVRPVPAAFPAGATWLPARKLRLHEEWEPDVEQADVGAPLSRTVFLWADGLVAGQLPELEMRAPDGVRVYPDQAQSNDQEAATGFTAVAQRKFALIAGNPARVTFDAVSLPWWNTETDRLERAELPARTLRFSAAGVPAATGDGAARGSTAAATPAAAAESTAPGATRLQGWWPWLTAVASAAWVLTALAWWASARRGRRTPSTPRAPRAGETLPHGARAAKALKSACADNDPAAAAAAVLAWARASERPGATRTRSLRDAAALALEPDLGAEILALDRALYGTTEAPWHGDPLWQAFRREPRQAPPATRPSGTTLPPILKLAGK